jgi:DNA-binding LytR/AlgR family response regulator
MMKTCRSERKHAIIAKKLSVFTILKTTRAGKNGEVPSCEDGVLKVSVRQISIDREERAIIQCYEVSDDVKSIVSFIKSTGATLAGYVDERVTQIPLQDIFFVEAVDNKVFACTAKKVYELKYKLYEFVTLYENRRFFRCSKSFVINLMKIDSVRPILNGRFCATLFNGEEVIISRQYVPELKKRLLGESI